MTAKNTDNETIARMRAANPVSVAEVRGEIDEHELRRAMDAAIARGAADTRPAPRGFNFRRRPSRLLAGLACAGALALVVMLPGAPGGGGQPEFAAAAIRVAEANPRLLVTDPGWAVIDASEFETHVGEITFGDGTHTLSIHWYPAWMYHRYLGDRADVSTPETSTLLGQTTTTVHYGGTEYATMLSPQGSVFIEIRGRLESRAEYDDVLRSLRPVDVETWLGAMPPNVVRPEDRGAVVERMLRGVPMPPGFDAAALAGGDSVSNHYQLAAEVTGAVSCGWVESWLAATQAGDAAAAREAVDAMASSRDWPVMDTLSAGGWAANIWHIAEELESGHLNRGSAGSVVNSDGSGYELGPAWALALGCESQVWRRPLAR